MSEDSPSEDFLDEVVESYIQKQIAAGEAAGQSQRQIDQNFDAASFILCVRMLAKWGGDHLPEGAELLRALGELTGGNEAECRQLCSGFIRAGWMDAGYCLTERGHRMAHIEGDFDLSALDSESFAVFEDDA